MVGTERLKIVVMWDIEKKGLLSVRHNASLRSILHRSEFGTQTDRAYDKFVCALH